MHNPRAVAEHNSLGGTAQPPIVRCPLSEREWWARPPAAGRVRREDLSTSGLDLGPVSIAPRDSARVQELSPTSRCDAPLDPVRVRRLSPRGVSGKFDDD